MKDMHIDEFAMALAAFDSAMDKFARNQGNGSYIWTTDAEPLVEGRDYTISRAKPITSNGTCSCGNSCSCVENRKANVRFEDILDDVQQVIFNDPATIVIFSDGSKVCVKACAKDTFNKETGLIYAIIKRLYANDVDETTGYLRSSGLGEKISKILKKATDQKETERIKRRKLKQAKKEAAKKLDEKTEKTNQEG